MSSSKPLVTPEEMLAVVQSSSAELMEGIGIGREKRMRKLKKLLNSKSENIAKEALKMACQLGGDFPAEKQSHSIEGPIVISWEE